VPFYKTGKMDTSDLSERYFDENSVLYSVSKRNSTVFEEGNGKKKDEKAAESTKKSKKAKTEKKAKDAAQDNKDNKKNDEQAQGGDALDTGAHALLEMWQKFKTENPDGTLSEFYATLANTNQEG
jgi:hypothetical protein